MIQTDKRFDVVISLVGTVLALLTLYVWIPSDIDTGVIDIWRRSVRIGDTMLPTFAAGVISGSSIVIGLRALLGHASGGARAMSLEFMAMVLAVFIVSIAVIWGAGPALSAFGFQARCRTGP